MRVPSPQQQPETRTTRARYGKGEPRGSFLKIPNEYFDLIKTNKLGGAIQSHVILIIMRNTWGVKGRPEWAPMSLPTLVEACGGVSKGSLSWELQDLKERGLIEIKDSEGCKTELKLYKVTVDRWKDAKPYVKKDDPRPPAPAGSGDRLIVKPGMGTTFVPARLALPDREPCDFRIGYTSSFAQPVAVSSSITDDLVLIHFDSPERANEGQTSVLGRERKTDSFTDNNRLTSIIGVTQKLFLDHFGKAFNPDLPRAGNDRKFLAKIVKAAGAEMPADYLDEFCRQELRAMVRRRKEIYPGILIPLAEQAARNFKLNPPVADATQTTPPAPLPPPPPLDPAIAWDNVRKQLRAICTPETYDNWFAYTRQISAGKTSIVVAVSSEAHKLHLESDEDLKARLSEACAYTEQPSKIIWKVEP